MLERIGEINATATLVKAEVDNYKAAFAEFDTQLENRKLVFEAGSEQIKELGRELESAKEFAEKVISDAKEALGWGTVQSLTQSFATSARELETPVKRATVMVYISLAILAAWVVLVFIIPARIDPSLQLFLVPDKVEGWAAILYVFGNLGVRIAVVSPAVLFALFSLNRYRTFSHLRQQYIFKKTVASAIPGFKEQAAAQDDPHSKAMTLAAFERLLFNPAEIATRDFGGHSGGGWLSRRLVTLVRQAMDDARK